MLRLVLPKGSLEQATLELFAAADLAVIRGSEVDYRATIDDPRVDEVRILRPQEIPVYVADGLFDLGITGRDWIEERGRRWSRSASWPTPRPRPIPSGWSWPWPPTRRSQPWPTWPAGGCGSPPSTPSSPAGLLEAHGVEAEIRLSYGATEAKVPDIADCVVEITETGPGPGGRRAADRRTPSRSRTELIANPAAAADPAKRHAMDQLLTLLQGTLEARGKVLVKLNVPPPSSRR